jgi:type III pantothenate kinase
MLLTIDIGNSSTKFGIFDGTELVRKFSLPTRRDETAAAVFARIGERIPAAVSSIVIATVVGELVETYRTLGETFFGTEPYFADHGFDYGFEINYFPPQSCGADRLVGAFAAVEKYGRPVIVCDFGTATNIEVVNGKGIYLGGVITPGIDTLAAALFEKTSKLPNVELFKPEKAIGNSTVSAIRSGIYFGYIGLVDGIIRRLLGELDEDAKIISTGGFAGLIAEESKYVGIIEENLILEGLRLIDEKLNGNRNL